MPPELKTITVLKLIWRNTVRHLLRASLTIPGMAVAVLASALLRTMVPPGTPGWKALPPTRLVTRNAISPGLSPAHGLSR